MVRAMPAGRGRGSVLDSKNVHRSVSASSSTRRVQNCCLWVDVVVDVVVDVHALCQQLHSTHEKPCLMTSCSCRTCG